MFLTLPVIFFIAISYTGLHFLFYILSRPALSLLFPLPAIIFFPISFPDLHFKISICMRFQNVFWTFIWCYNFINAIYAVLWSVVVLCVFAFSELFVAFMMLSVFYSKCNFRVWFLVIEVLCWNSLKNVHCFCGGCDCPHCFVFWRTNSILLVWWVFVHEKGGEGPFSI